MVDQEYFVMTGGKKQCKVHTGPKGGKYYMNKGKKVYIINKNKEAKAKFTGGIGTTNALTTRAGLWSHLSGNKTVVDPKYHTSQAI
jgi:hypothetical protein